MNELWFALSYVDGAGTFRMSFNIPEAGVELVKSRLAEEGGGNFMVTIQPCHYSPEGLRDAGFNAATVSE